MADRDWNYSLQGGSHGGQTLNVQGQIREGGSSLMGKADASAGLTVDVRYEDGDGDGGGGGGGGGGGAEGDPMAVDAAAGTGGGS